jgi:hypothetical protein
MSGNILGNVCHARCSQTPWALAPHGLGCATPDHHAHHGTGYARGAQNVHSRSPIGLDGAPGV